MKIFSYIMILISISLGSSTTVASAFDSVRVCFGFKNYAGVNFNPFRSSSSSSWEPIWFVGDIKRVNVAYDPREASGDGFVKRIVSGGKFQSKTVYLKFDGDIGRRSKAERATCFVNKDVDHEVVTAITYRF